MPPLAVVCNLPPILDMVSSSVVGVVFTVGMVSSVEGVVSMASVVFMADVAHVESPGGSNTGHVELSLSAVTQLMACMSFPA